MVDIGFRGSGLHKLSSIGICMNKVQGNDVRHPADHTNSRLQHRERFGVARQVGINIDRLTLGKVVAAL